jgi:hypothetical protein
MTVLYMLFSEYPGRAYYDRYRQVGDEITHEAWEELEGNYKDKAMEFLATLDPADVYGIVEKKKSFKVYYVRREA